MAKVKYRSGLRKRLRAIADKSSNYRGFGTRIAPDSCKWYSIEFNVETEDDTELIELHWIKVQVNDEHRRFIRQVMIESLGQNCSRSEDDFVAAVHFAISMTDRTDGVNAAFLFPAIKKGDKVIREPIGQAYGVQDYQDPIVRALAFKCVEVDEVVPGDLVNLETRKLNKHNRRRLNANAH